MWGIGLAYATDYSGNVQDVYHTDGLGSVRVLTNAAGAITQTYQTDEFGVASLIQGTSTQPFGYTGEQTDAESSFVFLRARYYAPSLGRFLSRDPVLGNRASPLSLHRYVYVRDNPANGADPSGFDCGFGTETPPGQCGGGDSVGGGGGGTPGPDAISEILKDAYALWQELQKVPELAEGGLNPWQGTPLSTVLDEPATYYRTWSGNRQVGRWLAPFLPMSAEDAVNSLALPPSNTAEFYSEVHLPAGTRIQIGYAAPVPE